MLLAVFAARLCQIALVDGGRLATIARKQHAAREERPRLRGAIFDRAGDPLAITVDAGSVFLRPRQLDHREALGDVARALRMTPQQWLRKTSTAAPFLDLTSGYVQRSIRLFPKQGMKR